MMLIAFGIVLLLLPLLGYLGAFKAVKERYTEVTMVKLPPPPPQPKQPAAKKARPKPQVHHGGHTHVSGGAHPLPVHVAAAAPSPGAAADDNAIQNGSGSNIGQVPPTPAAAPPVQPVPAPASQPTAPKPATIPPAPPAAPPAQPDQPAQVLADSQVKPEIPDDLRDSDLDAQFRALFTVHPDGTADVKMVSSTGSNELDQLAMQAAREWKFRPALHDGRPVESYLRLYVEFQVS